MRKLGRALGAVFLGWGLLTSVNTAHAMPSFARQTGMPCTSCHVGTDPVPNFTRTGRLFAMHGYTTPVVRERMTYEGQAIQNEPQYGGEYLRLNWMDFFAARFVSDFVSTGHFNDGTTKPTTSKPLSRMALFFTGPITDWLGLWTEIGYLGNNDLSSVSDGHTGPTGLNLFAYDEYRLTATFNYGKDSFWGVAVGNEVPDVSSQFNFPVSLPRPWSFGQGVIGKSMDLASFTIHTLWHNRLWLQAGPVSGINNLNWSNGTDWWGSIGWDFFRKQSNDLWLVGMYLGGKDAPSMLTPEKDSFICPASCPSGVTDANFSITNTLGGASITGAPLEQVDHFNSYKVQLESSVGDMGVNSWDAAIVVAGMDQDYKSGASASYTQLGLEARYFYKRTYGIDLYWSKYINYTYTSSTNQEIDTYGGDNYGVTFLWNPAMNFSVHVNWVPKTHNRVFKNQMNLYQNQGDSLDFGVEYSF